MSNNIITGQCFPDFSSKRSGAPAFASTEATHTLRANLDKWYLKPLEEMEEHEAFVCLCVCFPIYEKFLRASEKIGAKEHFTEGHRVFNFLGKVWGCSKSEAYAVWSCWRNGLLHQAMVKKNEQVDFFMSDEAEFERPVNVRGCSIIVNPWKIRDSLFAIIEGRRDIWKDDDHPFMRVYKAEA
jgi:hypothetical protein